MQIVYLNGEFVPLAEARISVLDRGFIFGDGIYEVVPAYRRVPFRWQEHRARMRRSLGKIRLADPLDDAGWAHLVGGLIERHPWDDQFIYLQVTRGVARRDHAFPAAVTPTVFAMASEFKPPTAETAAAGAVAITRADDRWLHCDIKSTSLLGNVLARQDAADAGALEAVMFRDGFLTEASASNVWVVSGGQLLAPPRDALILEGIRYGLIETLANEQGIPFAARRISRDEVAGASELLLTSATKEIVPVLRLDGRPIGDGRPGPVFRKLFDAYQQAKAAAIARGWPPA
ncbi:MAG: D-amino acid aminotransferase [Lautropia sp.]